MRVRPISDLHLDFYRGSAAPWSDPSDDYDVLAVLGDISNPVMAGIEELAREVDRSGKPCVYVPGNHCGYRGPGWENTFWEQQMSLLEEFGGQNGITVINRRAVVIEIDGVEYRFVGCPGWPELAAELVPPFMTKMEAMFAADRGWVDNPFNRVGKSHDFSEIRSGAGNNRHRLTPRKMLEWSKADTAFLRDELSKPFDGETVVMTHVGPASLVAPGMHSWLYGSRVNEDLICAPSSGVSTWLSGHTHRTFDVEVGGVRGVRCVSNARGYPNENPSFDPALVIEVGHDLTPKLGM